MFVQVKGRVLYRGDKEGKYMDDLKLSSPKLVNFNQTLLTQIIPR